MCRLVPSSRAMREDSTDPCHRFHGPLSSLTGVLPLDVCYRRQMDKAVEQRATFDLISASDRLALEMRSSAKEMQELSEQTRETIAESLDLLQRVNHRYRQCVDPDGTWAALDRSIDDE